MKAIAVGSIRPKAACSGERANMKTIAVGLMRPKAAGSGERTSVGVRSGSVRLGI